MVMKDRPVLYVGVGPRGEQAISLLKEAGFDVEVRCVPIYHPVAIVHGLPALYGLSGCFEGMPGIEVFIENAKFLGLENLSPTAT